MRKKIRIEKEKIRRLRLKVNHLSTVAYELRASDNCAELLDAMFTCGCHEANAGWQQPIERFNKI